jgi:hypothetical protein
MEKETIDFVLYVLFGVVILCDVLLIVLRIWRRKKIRAMLDEVDELLENPSLRETDRANLVAQRALLETFYKL